MSCDNVQKLISPLLDRKTSAAEQENALVHLEGCRECSAHLESLQAVQSAVRDLRYKATVPSQLSAQLRVMASHERQRQVTRASFSNRLDYVFSRLRLTFDNMMRPLALPFAGGLLSALAIFSILVPSLSFGHNFTDESFYCPPGGEVVVLDSQRGYRPGDNMEPRIEPADSESPEDANVVWLLIDASGKVSDYSVVRGHLTSDLKSLIVFSQFTPATNFGLPTLSVVKVVQQPTPVRRSMRS